MFPPLVHPSPRPARQQFAASVPTPALASSFAHSPPVRSVSHLFHPTRLRALPSSGSANLSPSPENPTRSIPQRAALLPVRSAQTTRHTHASSTWRPCRAEKERKSSSRITTMTRTSKVKTVTAGLTLASDGVGGSYPVTRILRSRNLRRLRNATTRACKCRAHATFTFTQTSQVSFPRRNMYLATLLPDKNKPSIDVKNTRINKVSIDLRKYRSASTYACNRSSFASECIVAWSIYIRTIQEFKRVENIRKNRQARDPATADEPRDSRKSTA